MSIVNRAVKNEMENAHGVNNEKTREIRKSIGR